MRKLAYYSAKENKFHEKRYDYYAEIECKHDFGALKKAKVPFLYSAHYNIYGAGGTLWESYGLDFGKCISITELPENIRKIFEDELTEDIGTDYGGKREFNYEVYESENWYGLWVDCGEDDFENEVEFCMFITKDGNSTLYV